MSAKALQQRRRLFVRRQQPRVAPAMQRPRQRRARLAQQRRCLRPVPGEQRLQLAAEHLLDPLRRVQPADEVTQGLRRLVVTVVPRPGLAVTRLGQRADDRRVLAVVLARHAVERLAVVLHRLGADAPHLDAGVRQRLTQHVAVGAARFHRHHQRAVPPQLG